MMVIRIDAPAPISTKPASTSAPMKVQSVPIRMFGVRYSMAVGRATASNMHTFT